jgi:endonuclease/exonuclease/phosphatase family metal-dependent hydrolase
MNKKIVTCLSMTALLVLGGCCGRAQGNSPRVAQFSSFPPNVIKAMSFNIRVDTFLDGFNGWSKRKQRVIDILASDAPDVAGLQEALDHQVQQIQQALPQYSHYAVGRNDGRRKGESCAIFYRKDRFALDDSGTFWFSNTPRKPGSKGWGNIWPRICSWVHLSEQTTGAGFYVYNVHLAVLSQHSRQKSVELLARRIAARKIADPFIVTGDFNMRSDNPAMVYLQNAHSTPPYPRMVCAWQSLHPDHAHHSFWHHPSGPKIDHIPLSDGVQALKVEVDRRRLDGGYASDHFPVMATVLFAGLSKPLEPVAAGADLQKPQPNHN